MKMRPKAMNLQTIKQPDEKIFIMNDIRTVPAADV
jgi:hypothetical protein